MSDEIIDIPELMERVQDDKELMLELFDIFIEDYQGKRRALTGAVEKNDCDEVRSIAHSVKGASGNISAKYVREICLNLEMMGKDGNLSGAKELLVKLDEEYTRMVKRIEEIKAGK